MVDCREIMPYTYANKSLLFSEAFEDGKLFCIDKETAELSDYASDEFNKLNIIFESCTDSNSMSNNLNNSSANNSS